MRTNQKYTIEEVKTLFYEQECKLLEEKYTNNQTLMTYRCKCGNIAKIKLNSFLNGSRCFDCCGKKRKNIEELQKYFAEQGCQLISDKYTNAFEKLQYICSCGNKSSVRWNDFQQGSRCDNCRYKRSKRCGKFHPKWIKDRTEAKFRRDFSKRINWMLKGVLKYIGQNKNNKSSYLLGYTSQQLREYITNHPNWNSVKNTKWHLDHIFPVKAFVDHKIHNLKLINCFENLQPVEAKNNLIKSSKYKKEEFIQWLHSKGVNLDA